MNPLLQAPLCNKSCRRDSGRSTHQKRASFTLDCRKTPNAQGLEEQRRCRVNHTWSFSVSCFFETALLRRSITTALVGISESKWLISPHLLEVIDWSACCYAVARVIARWFLAGFRKHLNSLVSFYCGQLKVHLCNNHAV